MAVKDLEGLDEAARRLSSPEAVEATKRALLVVASDELEEDAGRAGRMRLPNPENAVADVRKLCDYCLNPERPRGRHKAQVFSVALGLDADDAEELREALLSAALSERAVLGEEDEYGKRYVLDFEMSTEVETATVRHGEDFPRLTSCYVV